MFLKKKVMGSFINGFPDFLMDFAVDDLWTALRLESTHNDRLLLLYRQLMLVAARVSHYERQGRER